MTIERGSGWQEGATCIMVYLGFFQNDQMFEGFEAMSRFLWGHIPDGNARYPTDLLRIRNYKASVVTVGWASWMKGVDGGKALLLEE